MYADDLVIVAEHLEELLALEEWNELFNKHGLKMNLGKAEVVQGWETERGVKPQSGRERHYASK